MPSPVSRYIARAIGDQLDDPEARFELELALRSAALH
jgi:hypothetical protein